MIMKCFREKAWGFPIFVSTRDQPNAWCQFRPRSDFMVSSRLFLCPLLISEVVSQGNEQDRYRILLQATAVARAGQYLIQAGSQFFVVAIYLRANLIAERYIVAHIALEGEESEENKDSEENEDSEDNEDSEGSEGRGESEESPEIEQREKGQVHISQKDFDLTTAGGAVAFLREMYNLVALVEQMAANLDAAKKDNLLNVKMAASKVISLSSKATQRQPTLSALAPIPEGNGDDETQDDLGVFGADDIQALLRRMNYKINFILFGVLAHSYSSVDAGPGYQTRL
ncbi:hypothetical protein K503DRAFT_787947 [Rhizopogon vinicolor AM-OR11-026]|uniref:Uncharacterized protein n=1 Tax=Rhizopogon vinicolor AM-OR11-026 TaxID=1314800 RepID=A0A1B7MF86_9AGAM|nr:hypothetical protein K503DRAFT_787947 [Rhizopogon vinicolor AM-OR11-026]